MTQRTRTAIAAMMAGILLVGQGAPALARGDRPDLPQYQNGVVVPQPGVRPYYPPGPPAGRPPGQYHRPPQAYRPPPGLAHRGPDWERHRYVERYYRSHPHDPAYYHWRQGQWGDDDYRNWYAERHRDDHADAAIAALFGFAAGALLGGALSQPQAAQANGVGSPQWLDYCRSRYRSFDARTGTYVGYDGQRHPCR